MSAEAQGSLVAAEATTHRKLLLEAKVSPKAITGVNARGAQPLITPRPSLSTAVRILNWNVLADGLGNDGFTVRDVLSGGTPTDTDGMIKELMETKRRGGDMDEIRSKFATERTAKNLSVVIDWPTRWARMRVVIEKLQPDVVTFQELDHFVDCSADMRALGFECTAHAGATGRYTPCHAAGVGGPGLEAAAKYLKHVEAAGMAFAPGAPSNARRIAREAGRADADDDGVAIFWRARAFEPTGLSFLVLDDPKKSQAVVRAKLKRKADGASLCVLCAHLASGTKAEDEAKRVEQITAPTFDASSKAWQGPSILTALRESANEGATVFCLDANSAPDRAEDSTVWKALRRVMPCVWDGHFDTTGRPLRNDLVVTSNKLRGPESDQPRKIGEHVCLVRRARARARHQALGPRVPLPPPAPILARCARNWRAATLPHAHPLPAHPLPAHGALLVRRSPTTSTTRRTSRCWGTPSRRPRSPPRPPPSPSSSQA